MNWYVRTECGDVRGPMSQEDAEHERDRLDDAVMFDERIFSLEFCPEVDELLREMESGTRRVVIPASSGSLTGINSEGQSIPIPMLIASLQGLLVRASEAIISLSAKKADTELVSPQFVTTSEVELLLRDLRGMKDGESDGLGELCQRAIDAITLLCGKARRVELEMDVDVARLMLDLDKVLVGELRERAAKAIIALSAKNVEAPLSSQEVLKRMQQDLPGIIEELIEKQLRDNPL